MRIPKLSKNMLMYLPVLAVLGATVIGLLIGEELYPTMLYSQSTTPTQFSIEPNDAQLLPVPAAEGTCFGAAIYLSLPPKCKNAEGDFIPIPGTIWKLIAIPERK